MKLAFTFEHVDMGDETVSVPVGKGSEQVHGVLKLNKEGKEILDMLSSDTTEQDIINTLAEKYTTNKQTIATYVKKVISTLNEEGLIMD